MYTYDPYTLPTINFVGGATLPLTFNVYKGADNTAFDLQDCTVNFAVISFSNRSEIPLIDKEMEVNLNAAETSYNVLTVELDSSDTVGLCGKYIYQITVVNAAGKAENPKQGIMFITNNINKSFLM